MALTAAHPPKGGSHAAGPPEIRQCTSSDPARSHSSKGVAPTENGAFQTLELTAERPQPKQPPPWEFYVVADAGGVDVGCIDYADDEGAEPVDFDDPSNAAFVAYACNNIDQLRAERDELRKGNGIHISEYKRVCEDNERLRAAAQALVDALPSCGAHTHQWECTGVATQGMYGQASLCDEHAVAVNNAGDEDCGYAEQLRDILALLKEQVPSAVVPECVQRWCIIWCSKCREAAIEAMQDRATLIDRAELVARCDRALAAKGPGSTRIRGFGEDLRALLEGGEDG